MARRDRPVVSQQLAGGGAGSIIAWVILGVLVAIVIVVVARESPARCRPCRRTRSSSRPSQRRSAVNWRAEAERLEAEGNWKDALRCRYRSLVMELIERDVLRDRARVERRGSTGWSYGSTRPRRQPRSRVLRSSSSARGTATCRRERPRTSDSRHWRATCWSERTNDRGLADRRRSAVIGRGERGHGSC